MKKGSTEFWKNFCRENFETHFDKGVKFFGVEKKFRPQIIKFLIDVAVL